MTEMFSGYEGEVIDLRNVDAEFVLGLDRAFYNCPNLTTIYLPSSIDVKKMTHTTSTDGIYWETRTWMDNVFSKCPKLETIYSNRDWVLENMKIKHLEMFAEDISLPNFSDEKSTGKFALSYDDFGYGYFTRLPAN